MAKGSVGKNYWILLLMLLAGIVLGGLIGHVASGVPALKWLDYGQTYLRVNSMLFKKMRADPDIL